MAKAKATTPREPKAKKGKASTAVDASTTAIDAKGRTVSITIGDDSIVVSKDRTTRTKTFSLKEEKEALEYFEHLKVCTQN